MMKRVVVDHFGGPEVLRIVEEDDPRPGGHCRARAGARRRAPLVRHAAGTHADALAQGPATRRGTPPPRPRTGPGPARPGRAGPRAASARPAGTRPRRTPPAPWRRPGRP